jgi:hypothetical protein
MQPFRGFAWWPDDPTFAGKIVSAFFIARKKTCQEYLSVFWLFRKYK